MGRPLQTRIPRGTLIALAAVSIAGAVGLGVLGAIWYDPWLLAFVAFGGFIVAAYNLELAGGRFHDTFWFALAWGAFPALTAYFVTAERLRIEAFLVAAYASCSALPSGGSPPRSARFGARRGRSPGRSSTRTGRSSGSTQTR